MLPLTDIKDTFPTLHQKNVPIPPQQKNNGWWSPSCEPSPLDSQSEYVSPTWSGQADNLIKNGAMPETSYQYPAGGIRPGNNEPAFFNRFVQSKDGHTMYQPYQKTAPFDPKPFSFDN
ncbi:hypothetical protein TetV_464 [Tetraselmis virus 1]|uniref:Uncharacterized protein n=1 Tax=Tetraselmis virus 1 TaxID=2060617 RepID=A0A2P0VNQ8_9VIRU|nr:hypothetical protein QJ968_gp590 [Tetraselmis virus 1]AUF82546.1 hypothetical protein TetV_464 [Tetraselmis virus 1]